MVDQCPSCGSEYVAYVRDADDSEERREVAVEIWECANCGTEFRYVVGQGPS